MTVESSLREHCRIKNQYAREFLAEFLGTFVLIAFGDASVAQFVLGRGGYGTFLTVNWAWGLAVAMGVWVSGGVSGGHINPAVSLANSIVGRLPWSKLPVYIIAQYLGAIVASACVFGVYWDALEEFDGGNRTTGGPLDTAGIWATYPQEYLTWGSGLGDQIFGTAMLVMCAFAITDENNMTPPKGLVPLCIGLVVAVIGMTYGLNCGYAINPARDLGPRIFTAMAGWGTDPFSFNDYNWFWIPVIGPHIGGIIGAFIYLLFVGIHIPDGHDDDYTLDEDPFQMSNIQKKGVQGSLPPVDYDNPGYSHNSSSDLDSTPSRRV